MSNLLCFCGSHTGEADAVIRVLRCRLQIQGNNSGAGVGDSQPNFGLRTYIRIRTFESGRVESLFDSKYRKFCFRGFESRLEDSAAVMRISRRRLRLKNCYFSEHSKISSNYHPFRSFLKAMKPREITWNHIKRRE